MHQFGSKVLVADAYRQERLAQASRVRPIPDDNVRKAALAPPFWQCCHRVGTALVWVGQRLQGGGRIEEADRGPVVITEPGRAA